MSGQLIQDVRMRSNYKPRKGFPTSVKVIWGIVALLFIGLVILLIELRAIYI